MFLSTNSGRERERGGTPDRQKEAVWGRYGGWESIFSFKHLFYKEILPWAVRFVKGK